jgi:hypothetical protein
MENYAFCPNRVGPYSARRGTFGIGIECLQRGTPCQHPSGDCEDRSMLLAQRHLEKSGIASHGDVIKRIVQAGITEGISVPD